MAGGTMYIFRLTDPYTYFGSAFTLSAIGLIAVTAITVLVFCKKRFFCTNICPVGTLLGLISLFSLNKIQLKESCISCGICERACPADCIDSKENRVNNETCLKCLKCLNVCNKDAIKYGTVPAKPVRFNPQRRSLILAGSTVAVFATAVKAGSVIKKVISEKFSDVILPPGAINEERFLNKCLNCNLCVKACPEKIIKKADKNYGAVSIDYSQGFCRYDCKACSAACPAGALQKLSLTQKQRLRIAMIQLPPVISTADFRRYIDACPTDALTITDNKPSLLASKCIGCGACVTASGGNIKIYGVKKQIFL
jgi:Fe-S-cluster-containing hydrogenase component 2